MNLIPKHLQKVDNEPRLAIDSQRSKRPPMLFLELDSKDIDGAAGDNIITVLIQRQDGKIARVNLRLHATSDGNKVKAEVNTVGLTNETTKTVQAKFVWVQDENGDLDYPKHPIEIMLRSASKGR